LQKLKVLGSVLYVAAHPDDENTRLIAYLSKDKLYRTGYLSLTRGDGGQNLIGNEQGIELGLIRTQELLAARRIDGGEQFFTRAFDFGFSKNPEETFRKWDKEKILSDVVWVIRKFQPDVIITRFPTTGEGGHGHHTASAILANEAFTAAADPNRFPEQLRYVKPWQAKRIVWNSFNFGGGAPPANDTRLRVDVGGYNPLLGQSYGEIAAESRSQHKSQGFGVAAGRGEAFEYFTTTGGATPRNDLVDDVDISWRKIKGGESISAMVDAVMASFDMHHPEKSIDGLVVLYKALKDLEDGYWKNKKIEEVKLLIAECSGLFIDVTTNSPFAVQTDSMRVSFTMNNRLGPTAALQRITMDKFDSSFTQPLAHNRNFTLDKIFYVPSSKPLTQPYWLVSAMADGYYNVSDSQQIGQPDIDPAYRATIQVNIGGESFTFTRPVKYKHTDPVKGELYQPVFVIPAATITSSTSLVLFRNDVVQERQIGVQANANKVLPKNINFFLRGNDTILSVRDTTTFGQFQSKKISFYVNNSQQVANRKSGKKSLAMLDSMAKKGKKPFTAEQKKMLEKGFVAKDSKDVLYAYAQNGDSSAYYLSIRAINYDHIPSIKYFFPDVIKTLNINLKTVGKSIGYITGAGDKVPEALEEMGYDVTLLTDKELARNNLSQFDAIITGVRAYNTNEWMNDYYDKLMKYVNEGGNLIVQYNTSTNIGPVKARIAPYNFSISRTRVTDENAAVTFLNPAHPVLNYPNKITEDDFKDWVQERSIYHASNWDTTKFETVISMHDPDEKPDAGSLIIAKYGKGYITYTGIVFYRELPGGVPGAYRLLANIIALNRKKPF
jgi:LmbE family N-acetylglucosaminyl deacetylase